MAGLPLAVPERVAILVLNHNGRPHLEACLPAVLALDGLAGPEAVVVADNGSTDGSLELVDERFPGVRALAFEANVGFALGNDRAAERVEADYVLFLNNDTRIDQGCLRRLCDAVGGEVACAGARLVSWDGRRLDFDGGGAAFTGHGHALGYGRPVPWRRAPAGETLFGSGAAMLAHRDTFLRLGGFDADYFAYYEDVDLGWRMWLAGYRVRHVPAAVVRHRHHGTIGQLPRGEPARLYERNAIATVVKNYDHDVLARVLPAALALAAHRAGARMDVIDSADPVPAGPLPVPGRGWAGWPALAPLKLDLDALARRRRDTQALRRRADTEIVSRLAVPLTPVPATEEGWRALGRAAERFELAELFGPVPDPGAASGGVRRLLTRTASAMWHGGPRWLADEVLRHRRWRREGRP